MYMNKPIIQAAKLKDYIDLTELLKKTLDRLNTEQKVLLTVITTKKMSKTKYGAIIGGLFEFYFIDIAQSIYPGLNIIHPDNDCELGDAYSITLGNGIELKFTLGWNNGQIAWSQSTVQSHEKDFLFIKGSIENCKLFIDFSYYGHMSYNDWTVHGKGMNVGPEKVQKFCERII